ncbi:MAG: GIY-YIG nuclease family protein [Kiritimatiellae bacterium]|nr:GIY-YIG nuclease family protein [Kiritimatiellia bacterium]
MTTQEEKQIFQTLEEGKNNYYVYALCKRDGTPFYIGKGSGSRVLDHRKAAVQAQESIDSDDTLTPTEKKAKIRDLTGRLKTILDQNTDLQMVIIKWGLTEKEALMCESALINILQFVNGRTIEELTNIINGHASDAEKTSRALGKKTKARTLEQFLDECAIADRSIEKLAPYRFVVININRLYPKCLDTTGQADLHKVGECVRACWWLGNINQKNRPDYILATYQMRVVGIFHVTKALTIKGELEQGRLPRSFPTFPKEVREDDYLRLAPLADTRAQLKLHEDDRKRLVSHLQTTPETRWEAYRTWNHDFEKFINRAYFKIDECGVNVPEEIMDFMNCMPTKGGTILTNPFGGVVCRHWTKSHGFAG